MRPELGRILIVDDNLEMARMVSDALLDLDYSTLPVASGKEAIERLGREEFDAVVTDLRMPDADGLEVLAAARRSVADRPVIVMTAYSAVDTAIESIRRGAYHYLTKPFKMDELALFLARALDEVRLRREAQRLRLELRERSASAELVARSTAMQRVQQLVGQLADTDVPVLITGETGTGKGMVARALHLGSKRAAGPLVTVNCAALPEALLESELFGHVKGAFSGAIANRPGLFTEASGGTLFLDEIGDMPIAMQAKLLHVIERGMVRPVGAEREHAVDVRLLTATNRDLHQAVRDGTFREDLLYRIDVVAIDVPPLRQRREDLLELLDRFIRQARERHPGAKVARVSQAAADVLLGYAWPGNVRELQHVVERLVLLGRAEEAGLEDLPASVRSPRSGNGPSFSGEIIPIRELERRYATWALEQMSGQKGKTAERLGIDEKTLWRWLSDRDGARN